MAESFLQPSPANLAAFGKVVPEKPVHMLNFLRFRERAEYPQTHEHASKNWTGQRAYQQYGSEIAGPFGRAGAKIIWQNLTLGTVIGPDAELWDSIFTVEYPNAQAFQTMISDPEYLKGAVNRTAALADSRLYLTQPSAQS